MLFISIIAIAIYAYFFYVARKETMQFTGYIFGWTRVVVRDSAKTAKKNLNITKAEYDLARSADPINYRVGRAQGSKDGAEFLDTTMGINAKSMKELDDRLAALANLK